MASEAQDRSDGKPANSGDSRFDPEITQESPPPAPPSLQGAYACGWLAWCDNREPSDIPREWIDATAEQDGVAYGLDETWIAGYFGAVKERPPFVGVRAAERAIAAAREFASAFIESRKRWAERDAAKRGGK